MIERTITQPDNQPDERFRYCNLARLSSHRELVIDPGILGASGVVLIGVSVLAGFLPARRATKVDPKVALNYE